jgi:hypothetical protein
MKPRVHESPLPVFDEAAAALRDQGIHVRASDWLRELDDDGGPGPLPWPTT